MKRIQKLFGMLVLSAVMLVAIPSLTARAEGANGVQMGTDGGWYYYNNGQVDYTYTGLATNEYGWWYVNQGVLDFGHTGLVPNDAGWWMVNNGAIDFGYNGLVPNEYGWWYVNGGAIDFNAIGLVPNDAGWWYVYLGSIAFDFTGLVPNEAGWWYVQNGAINFGYTGMACNEAGWWYVRDGAIDFGYTGLATNEAGTWYYKNGSLDFSYTGVVTVDGVKYNVVNGFVTGVYEDESPKPTEKPEPLSITIALPSDETHTEENQWYDRLCTELDEYLNMDITWEWLDTITYYEQLNLDIIAGDVADVMVVGRDTTFLQAAEEGLFWDLTDYIDDYDNFATIPQHTIENASYNGTLYGIPRSRTLARNGLGYRLDWLNNLGLEEPTDWESFYEMLYAFTYDDPDNNGVDDTVGLFLDSWSGVWDIMATWFGVPNEWGIDENGDLIHKSQTEEYKEALAAFRKLYEDGLINNGANGISDFQEVGAGKARNSGLRTGIGGCGIQVLDDLRKVQTYFEQEGMTSEDNILFTLQGAVDTGRGTLCYPTPGMNNMIVISTKTVMTEEQLKQVLQMLNDMCNGECLNLIEYGWEGVTYNLDENGYVNRWQGEQLGDVDISYRNGFNQVLAYFTAEENARPVTAPPATKPILKLEQKLYAENIPYCVTNYGASYVSDTYSSKGVALDALLVDARLKYITGEIDEAGLEEQLQKWWNEGGEQITKEMNELYHAAGN